MEKQKLAIKAADVKYLYAPQYKSLSIKELLEFAADYHEVEDYFPEARDLPMLPRQVSCSITPLLYSLVELIFLLLQWVLNVIYTVIGEPF